MIDVIGLRLHLGGKWNFIYIVLIFKLTNIKLDFIDIMT